MRVRHVISGEVVSVPLPVSTARNLRDPLAEHPWADWTDDTTPRTTRPVRFLRVSRFAPFGREYRYVMVGRSR